MLFKILCHLICRVSELNALDFNKDQILKNGLKIHLYTTLNRINYDLSVSNPMLNDIKKMYPHMFDIVIDVLGEINQLFDLLFQKKKQDILHYIFKHLLNVWIVIGKSKRM